MPLQPLLPVACLDGALRPWRTWGGACHTDLMIRLLTAFCLFFSTTGGVAGEITGKVIAVADGDTITVLIGHREIKVRLTEIDAPEKKQVFGSRSKQSLSDLCFGKRECPDFCV